MDNQHRQIKGYRELNQTEIDAMNAIKGLGPLIQAAIDSMPDDCDKRWQAIGKTELQQGLMALTSAIARPDFF